MNRFCTIIKLIDPKRYALILSLLLPFLTIHIFNSNDFYKIISLFVSSIIIFYNFPMLPKFLNMKPLYYEDLKDDTCIPEIKHVSRERFQNIFIIIQTFSLAIVFSILFDYVINHMGSTKLNFTEMIAFFGGFITIYQKASLMFGKLLISGLFWFKKRELEEQRNESKNIIGFVDLDINFNDSEFNIDCDTKCYEKYHKYMINNMNNNIVVNIEKNKSNDIVQLKLAESIVQNDVISVAIETSTNLNIPKKQIII